MKQMMFPFSWDFPEMMIWLIVFVPISVHAQETSDSDWEDACSSWMEEAVETLSEEEVEEWFESLEYFFEHPVNLNDASREDLESLPMLNLRQSEQLAYFLYRNVPLHSLNELLRVEGWDEGLLDKVRPFVYLGEMADHGSKDAIRPTRDVKTEWRQMMTKGRSQCQMRSAGILQHKDGYVRDDSLRALSKAYLGGPWSGTLRYSYQYKKLLQCGLSLEKDAGESSADFLTAYFQLKDRGMLRNLVVGDYKVSMGSGLVMSTGMFGGKSSAESMLNTPSAVFRPHGSTSEYGFLRGAAVDFGRERLRLAVFLSTQRCDASCQDSVFASFKQDGLHRTQKELEKKAVVRQNLCGARLLASSDHVRCSLNFLGFQYDKLKSPEMKLYNQFYFRGSQAWNASADFRMVYDRWRAASELAVDAHGKTAFLLSVAYSPHPLWSMMYSVRSYSPYYQAPYASSFGDCGSTLSNERGFFTWLDCRLVPSCTLTAYLDLVEYPWLKYGVNAPSRSTDWMCQLVWKKGDHECVFRLKEKCRSGNVPVADSWGVVPLQETCKTQLRLQWLYKQGNMRVRTSLDANWLITSQRPKAERVCTEGSALSIQGRYSFPAAHLTAAVQYSVFDTESYGNSVYVSAPELAGAMPFSSLSGQGFGYSALLTYKNNHIKISILCKDIIYSDREEMGSSLERMAGRRQTRLAATASYTW